MTLYHFSEHTEGSILGFDEVTYAGSVDGTDVTLAPVRLIAGYSADVSVTLHGGIVKRIHHYI